MARVVFPRALQRQTDGTISMVIEASSIRELFIALERRFPDLGESLRDGMAVAIDGEIISDPLLEPLEPDSEVHFLPAISGG